MKRFRSVMLCGCALLVGVPAGAQTTDANAGEVVSLSALTAGEKYPLSVKLKDMDANWRRISITTLAEANPTSMFGLGAVASDLYYTQGKMVRLGNETFIVAYREPLASADFLAIMRGETNSKPPAILSPQSVLDLALLNLRSVSSLKNIAPFNLKAEIARRNLEIGETKIKTAQDANDKSSSNLKQLGLGILMYASDYDEVFPSLDDAEAMKKAILPYLKSAELFVHPASREAYQPNASLSKKKQESLAEPASRVLAFESSPGTDGRRGVLYADGHVRREAETEWPQIKKASQVP